MQLTYWGLRRYDAAPSVRTARKALCKQMTALMLSQWQRHGHICENFGPHKDTGDCTGNRFYHWGAMAALKRHEATSEKKFAEFAVGQTVEFLNRLRPFVKERTNTCYSVEGLASAFALSDVVDLGRSIRRRLVRRIVAEMKKNRGFQVRPGQRTIPHGKGAYLQPEQSAGFAGAFLNGLGRPRTRIDFTQHCLSALVKYEKRGLGRFE